MITKDINVKVKKDEVKLNTMLYAYEGDRGLEFQLTLENWKYFFSQALGVEEDQLIDCSARILLVDPNGEKMKLVDVPIEENEVKFKVNQNLTEKVGDYKVYIQIFKEDGATVTCPPFTFTVKPLGDYTEVLPSDVGLIKVQDENLLAYNTISDYGIRTISELPKITEISDSDYVILQQNGITNIITTSDLFKKHKEEMISYTDKKDNEIREYVDTNVDNLNQNITNSLNSAKEYTDQQLEINSTNDKAYADAKLVEAKEYADNITNQSNEENKSYTDSKILEVKSYSDEKDNEVKSYADSLIEQLVGTAPETLDTIYEIAQALQENEGVVESLTSQISQKADKVHTHNATDIIEDETHKFVTDVEKNNWNDKYTKSEVDTKLEPKFDGVEVVEDKLQLKSGETVKGEVQLPKGFSGSYNDLTDIPESFSPSFHTHIKSDITDLFSVINSLDNDSTTDALSALQGKLLKERIDNIETTGTHYHSNKAELDKIVEGKVEEWDSKETVEGSQEKATEALNSAKSYIDSVANAIKGNVGEDYSTLEKIEMIIKGNISNISNLTSTSQSLTFELSNLKSDYEITKEKVELFEGSNHAHANKSTLDKITEEIFLAWNNKETTEGSQDKANKAYQDAKSYTDELFNSINFNLTKKFTVSEWILDEETGLYKSDLTHNLNNDTLIIDSYDTLSKSNELVSYTIKDNNTITILAKTNESIDIIIMAGNISTETYSSDSNINDEEISRLSTWSSQKISDELTQNLQKSKDYVDGKLSGLALVKKKIETIATWEEDVESGLFKSKIAHNLNSEDILIEAFNTNKYNEFVSFQVIDMNNIEIYSENENNTKVLILAL